MDISDIGSTDDTGLLCITNRLTNWYNSGGDWFAPNGDKVMFNSAFSVPGFTRNRGRMVVRLKKSPGGVPGEGVYQCRILDNQGTLHKLYVGIYTSEGGI